MAKIASVISVSLFSILFVMLSEYSRAREGGDATSDGVLDPSVRKDLDLVLSDRLSARENNEKFIDLCRAYQRLEKYVEEIEIATGKNDKQREILKNKREYLVEKLTAMMKRNAEMVERKLPDGIIKSRIDVLTEVRREQRGKFSMAVGLLSKINEQTAIDTLIDHIDRRWICSMQINGLIFGMGTNYPAALEMARAPMRCHDLIISRLLHFIANSDDAQKQKYCTAVLYARSGGTRERAIEKLNNAADGEKDPVKKERLQKQIEVLEKEAPEKYVLQEGGGTID